ncbi:MAG: ribose 5-phosphate isomerase B [bacterium]|nr:ribose 5-phosphate isomerase B [bacterium]
MTEKKLKIVLGSDHGGLSLKNAVKKYLEQTRKNIIIQDKGTYENNSVDYPDFGKMIADSILKKESDMGLLFCGTGIGISIAANRFKGIRAALVHNEFTAKMAKAHNNANILCLGGRVTPESTAKRLTDIWLDTPFEGGRHEKRLLKLDIAGTN